MASAGMPESRPPQRKVCAAHVGFKAAALLLYIFSGLFFSSEYVVTFVAVVLLSALDLWTVKNVTGRLLVGLRWWNEIDAEGVSHWRFESFEEQRFVHPTDSNVFWLTLFTAPAIWLLLAIGCMLTIKVQWLLLTVVALGMNGINVVGYIKCKKDARKKLQALGGSMAQEYGGRLLARGMQMWSKSAATRSAG
uniref:Golgi apparatus membrane protein TVP23 homolog n=1 Tax=Strombidinopsis acuminata TaxID=141414 RepID=A0A7S3W5D6_9SPIT